jgi:hypothetical protein
MKEESIAIIQQGRVVIHLTGLILFQLVTVLHKTNQAAFMTMENFAIKIQIQIIAK